MKFLNVKKGFIMHPITHVGFVAFILGMVFMYLIVKGMFDNISFLSWLSILKP